MRMELKFKFKSAQGPQFNLQLNFAFHWSINDYFLNYFNIIMIFSLNKILVEIDLWKTRKVLNISINLGCEYMLFVIFLFQI